MSFEDEYRKDRWSESTRTEGAAQNRLPYKVIGSDRRTDDPISHESCEREANSSITIKYFSYKET